MIHKYQIGDKVRVKPLTFQALSQYNGEVGVVEKLGHDYVVARFPVPHHKNQFTVWLDVKWITLAMNGIERAQRCLK